MWPSGLAAWLAYLRRFRRRSAADQRLIAGVADINDRTIDIVTALNVTRTAPVPHVALAYEVVADAAEAIATLIANEVMPENLDSTFLEERVALTRTLRAVQRQLFQLRMVSGVFQSKKILATETQRRIIENVRGYRVHDGETLAMIALSQLQSRDRWPELVTLNNLTWPFIGWRSDYPMARVIEPGEEILLPTLATAAGVVAHPATSETLFGVDLDLTSNQGQPTFELGDVKLISGVGNVQQAVRHRILTLRGALPLHSDYGCGLYQWVGKEGTPDVLRLALFDYVRSVLEDPRIVAVNRRTASLYGTEALLSLDAMVIGADAPVRLNVIVPSLGGPA